MNSFTARELAAMHLPGMPSTVRNIQLRAASERWPFTERPRADGRSLERVYPVTALPITAQAALARTEAARHEVDFADAPEPLRARALERVRLVMAVRELVASGLDRSDAYQSVAHGTEHSARSVERWFQTVDDQPEADWPRLLLPRIRTNKGEALAECHPEAWAYFKSDCLRGSRPAFAACYRRMATVAEAKGWRPVPCLKTLVRRFRREVPRTAQVLFREGPDALERMYPAQERDRSALVSLQAVNADGHCFDVAVRWPDGETVRPILVGFQDLASGKILSWRVDRTESGDLVRLAFADLVEHHGIPDDAYLDNGRGFANKFFTGGTNFRFRFKVRPEDPVGLLKQLGVRDHWTTPYHGQSKPIERAWRDLCENVARHPAFEGAYLGSNPTRKPHNYGQRAVELAEFLSVLDAQIREHNARTGRRSRVCQGRSFDQVFEAGLEHAVIRRATEAQRRLLFLASETLHVGGEAGELRFLGNRFWAEPLCELKGERVVARFDPQDVRRGLHVYRLDGDYVCHAELIELAGFADTSAARDHNRKRRAFAKAQKAAAEAERTFEAAELARLHLEAQGVPQPKPARKAKVTRGAFGTSRGTELSEAPPRKREQQADDLDFFRRLRADADAALLRRTAGE